MSDEWNRKERWESGPRRATNYNRRRSKDAPMSLPERRRMVQLFACLFIFGILFVGRGVSFAPLMQLGAAMGELTQGNADFRAAFSQAGQAVSQGEPFVQTLGVLWSDMLGNESAQETAGAVPQTQTDWFSAFFEEAKGRLEAAQLPPAEELPAEEQQPISAEDSAPAAEAEVAPAAE